MERNFRPAAANLYFMGNFSIYFTLALRTITQPTAEAVIPLGLVREGGLAWSSSFVCLSAPRARLFAFPWEKPAGSKEGDRVAEVRMEEENKVKPSRERWGGGGAQCLSFIDDDFEAQTMTIISENLLWIRHCCCCLSAQPHGVWDCQKADTLTKI